MKGLDLFLWCMRSLQLAIYNIIYIVGHSSHKHSQWHRHTHSHRSSH